MSRGSSRERQNDGVSRRRFIAAAGASGVAAGLAGCSTIGANPEGKRVQMIADSNAAGNADAIREALWNAGLNRDVFVEIIAGPSNSTSRQSQYTRWLSANLAEPDLLLMDSGWTIPFIVRQQILNFTKSEVIPDSLVSLIENDYFDASVSTAKHPTTDDLYGMPLFPDFPTMLYRRDLAEKAGYNPKQEKWGTESMHWKRFSKITKDIKKQNELSYGFTFQADIYEGLSCCDFNEFMTSWGGAYFGGRDNLFGPIGDRPVTVDEKPVVDAIRMLRSFISGPNDPHALPGYEKISPRAVLSWTENPSLAPFSNGNAFANRNWPYAIVQTGAEEVFGEDLGVMPIPYAVPDSKSKYENIGGPVAALGGWHMTVNPNSRNMDLAVQVLEAMAKDSFKFKLFEIIGWIPPEPNLLSSKRAKEVPIVGRYVEQLRVAGENAIPRPVTVVWPQESGKIAQQVHAGMSGAASPEGAMKKLQSQLKAIEKFNDQGK
ncbi:extracellular solute-binding protein [Halomarina pelagica]|uniref:extracellular solute-binding protein n=1 Tax=Halomarina pelagica TaxID=2961599 RepID=UPI0020C48A4B|nr:extracellular solute-binding protein [Halomarina sp. BND7]